MKIVILVDYSDSQFNRDFRLSNMLIEREHNVFLAINNEQFESLRKNCDLALLGYSINSSNYENVYKLTNDIEIEIDSIIK